MQYQESGIYHIYNRGLNRQEIFSEDDNYEYFISRMARSFDKYKIALVAYCLMQNHFHFLLLQQSETSISRALNSLLGGYTQAYNRRYKRSGTLFNGRTKAKRIEDESYLMNVIAYIHYNPVKAKLVSSPGEWAYSDFNVWISKEADGFTRNNHLSEMLTGEEYYQFFNNYTSIPKFTDISNYVSFS